MVEQLRAEQRARLARQQEPLIRLTAALQTMGRRPPALALVQPGTVADLVHVRSLLASTLPQVRARWRKMRRLRAELDALFPPTPGPGATRPATPPQAMSPGRFALAPGIRDRETALPSRKNRFSIPHTGVRNRNRLS